MTSRLSGVSFCIKMIYKDKRVGKNTKGCLHERVCARVCVSQCAYRGRKFSHEKWKTNNSSLDFGDDSKVLD